MKENLLWPKKLSMPPQLLIDVTALFQKGGSLNTSLVGFDYTSFMKPSTSSTKKIVNYRLISVGEDGNDTFRVGFIANVTGITGSDRVMAAISLPFQELEADIVGIRCHGWNKAGANIMNTPDKTVEKTATSITSKPQVLVGSIDPPSGHKHLFKMESSEFESNGSGDQFSSLGSGSSIHCNYTGSNHNISSDFPEIFGHYSTVALEIIVKIKVILGTYSYGFMVGIM